jgi:hypothetical protein
LGRSGGPEGDPGCRSAASCVALAKMGCRELVVYLDSIDERLLEYLDDDEELSLGTVQRLRFYTSALREGLITPATLHEDWPEWFDLAPGLRGCLRT